ncbi:MAG: hypothetical protein VB048_08795 [Bacteroidaceae bacterium]|jgi:UDP-2,4-diacetamido-2,4,6-trideoxy-beta-L-altropyranose hydrolase|nr:hypothetical protein [Bacteroidaceae bacterium]
MKPEVFILTNGNLQIGFGHIARTLVLASFFRNKGYRVSFIIPPTCSFIDIIKQENQVSKINSFTDMKEISSILDSSNAIKRIVIIDSVEEDYNALSCLRGVDNLFLVSITLFLFDIKNRYEDLSFYPEFSLNRIMSCENIQGRTLKIYTGKSFLIFRNEFKNLSKHVRKNGQKVLLTMGGADPKNLTLKVLNSISDFSNKTIIVLLNQSADCYEAVSQLCQDNDLILKNRVDNIAQLILDADIVVLNGGSTRYEACLCHTPFIAISIHKIQFKLTEKVTDITDAINLGIYDELDASQIDNSIENLLRDYKSRKTISNKMKNLLDTNGVERISNIIVSEYYNS